MPSVQRLLIVGSGDVARRAATWLAQRFRVFALVRPGKASADAWRGLGACPITGDLDQPQSLLRLAGLAERVLHLAPPQAEGVRDERTRHLLAALSQGGSLPRRLVYVSTTGVYGDCGGALIDETQPCRPHSARAFRRLDAENCLRRWGGAHRVSVLLLRAPGIYAAKDRNGMGERLPRARLEAGLPVPLPGEDVHSGHIHADDLARACCRALFWGGAGRSFNVVDESDLSMGDYFDAVADYLRVPCPPRRARAILQQQLSMTQL
ncbi:MAG: NAD-dependent epimerase/dehydratase family protein, partial [Zoogloeaceae bacterium]|nr:NAD-dependent epimerase/dehydratase family protein [Zoogloeaceae bacterium]